LFIDIVKDRSAETLEALINKKVNKESTVMTGGWKGYSGLKKLGFKHFIINHSKFFINPKNPIIHTQTIEGRWNLLKRFIRSKGSNIGNKKNEVIYEYILKNVGVNTYDYFITFINKVFN